jgi:hypothetical protein
MIEWQRGTWPNGLPERYHLLHLKLRSPDGRFKIAERVREPGLDGYPLFIDGVHVSTHRTLREARAAAEAAT